MSTYTELPVPSGPAAWGSAPRVTLVGAHRPRATSMTTRLAVAAVGVDVLALACAGVLTLAVRGTLLSPLTGTLGRLTSGPTGVVVVLGWLCVHLGVLRAAAPSVPRFTGSGLHELPPVLRGVSYAAALDLTAAFLGKLWTPRGVIALAWLLSLVLVVVGRSALLRWRRSLTASSGLGLPTLVLGSGAGVDRICREVASRPEAGLQLVGTLGDRSTQDWPWWGTVESFQRVLREQGVRQILVPSNLDRQHEAFAEALWAYPGRQARLSWIAVNPSLVQPDGRQDRLGPLGVIHLRDPRPRLLARGVRSVLDRLAAAVLLLLVSPVIAVAAVAVVLDSRGSAFFLQTRLGRDGRPFRMVKLRSMVQDAECKLAELMAQNQADGPLFKLRGDPRVTRVGRLLRRTSVDELPQLWNVVRGDMSLIGPRPPLPQEVAVYPDWFRRRMSVKPGITGLWQVSGRAELPFEEALKLDLCYVDDWSPWLDLQILLRTAATVVAGRGSY